MNVNYDLKKLGLSRGIYSVSSDAKATKYEDSARSNSATYDNRMVGTISAESFAAGKPRFEYSTNDGATWINPGFEEEGDSTVFYGSSICFRVRSSSASGFTFVKNSRGQVIWSSLKTGDYMTSPVLPIEEDGDYTVTTQSQAIFVNYADGTDCTVNGSPIAKGTVHNLATGDDIIAERSDLDKSGVVVNQEHYQQNTSLDFVGSCIFIYENRDDQNMGEDYVQVAMTYDG